MYKFIIFFIILLSLKSNALYWEKSNNIPEPYKNNYWLDVYFLPSNPNYGWVCGFNGRVIRTTDGGNSWLGSTIVDVNHLEHIHFPTLNIGYVSGPDGIFKSTDGGNTWVDITPSELLGFYWGCYFVDENNGILVGGGCINNQTFYKTTNGGISWTKFEGNVPGSGLTDVILYDKNGLGYAVSSGLIWRTLNGGGTWEVFSNSGTKVWQEELTNINNSFLLPYSGIDCQGWGPDGGARFTTNNGLTWNDFNTGKNMFGSFLINQYEGWVCGNDRNVYFTSDGGKNWEIRNCGLDSGNYDDMWFIDQNSGWIVGNGVYKLSNSKQLISKDTIYFDKVCLNDIQKDTLRINNLSFSDCIVNLSTNNSIPNLIINNNIFDFNIQKCNIYNIIIEYQAKQNIDTTIFLTIITNKNSINQKIYNIPIVIKSYYPTAFPISDKIIIDPVPVGEELTSSFKIFSNSNSEFLIEAIKIVNNQDINISTKLPIKALKNGSDIDFTIYLKDTGWSEVKYRLKFDRCNFDTIITIKAYGKAPIIYSNQQISSKINCNQITSDSIIIFNNGNDDLIITEYNLELPTNEIKLIGFKENLPIIIKPKKNLIFYLEYNLNQPKTINNTLNIKYKDNLSKINLFKNWRIKLEITNYTHKLVYEKNIDFGKICVNDIKIIDNYIKNLGNINCTIHKFNTKSKEFSFDFINNSNNILVSSLDSTLVRYSFQPKSVGLFKDTLIFLVVPCNDTIIITLKGIAVNNDILFSPIYIDTLIKVGDIVRYKINIKSKSQDVSINNIYIENENQNWEIRYNIKLPMVLLSGQETNFDLIISSLKESKFNSNLIIETNATCNEDYKIPLKLSSFGRIISIDKEFLNFGDNYCKIPNNALKLTIRNDGFTSDTITQINLSKNNFKILNLPDLPLILDPNANYILQISFNPTTEGIFLDELIIKSKEPNGQELKVILEGSYYTAKTVINTNLIDFGLIEHCEENKTSIITFYNSGQVPDTILFNYSKNNIYIDYTDYLIVPPGKYVDLTIELLTENLEYGENIEYVEFYSKFCDFKENVKIFANKIKPRLIVSPNILDFNDVWIGNTKKLSFELINNSNVDINIFDFDLNSNEFTISKTIPFTISSNSIVNVEITFEAKQEGNKILIPKFYYQSKCVDSIEILLNAYVPKEEYAVTLRIDKHIVDAGSQITFPIILDKPLKYLKLENIDIEITFDNNLFYPTNIFLKNDLDSKDLLYSYSFGKLNINIKGISASKLLLDSGSIIFIEGITFASIPDSTELHFSKVDLFTYKSIDIKKIDGLLKLNEFCKGTAQFKLKFIPLFNVSINQVITNNFIPLEIETTDNLNLNISIYDINGILNHSEILNINNKYFNKNIYINNFPKGVYFIKFTSNYQTKLYKFLKINNN